ncbi:TetR/AcrR family transcriptional regulator [Sunxiuqinia dokdonensis]|nr:TetR/AcrR family transcriptional regulator [Sunxiuqinia dokdonensis]
MKHTKEHILKEAFSLFMQKSFKEVTMKDIVEKTGMSKGAFYHYFPSKEAVFKEVVDAYFLAGLDTYFDNIPKDNLRNFINLYLQNLVDLIDSMKINFGLKDSKQGITYYSMSFDILRMFPEYEEFTAGQYKMELTKWEEVIANARRNGEIETSMSDSQLGKLFVVINDGLAVKLILQGRIDDLAGEMFTLFNAVYNMVKA